MTAIQLLSCTREVRHLHSESITAARNQSIAFSTLFSAFILVVSRFSYAAFMSVYQAHLIQTNQFALSHFYLDYSDVGASTIILTELILICLILRPKSEPEENDRPTVRTGLLVQNATLTALGIGFGVLLVPFTPARLQPFELAHLIVDNLLLSPKLLIPLVLLVALAWTGEIVFRRIMFSAWRGTMGNAQIILASSLVFAMSWPLTGAPSAFIIGLTAGILYTRTKRIWPGILATLLATLLCIGVLVWGLMTRGQVP